MPKQLLGLLLLFIVCSARAQTAPPANPNFKLFFEKTFLHTDREVYLQGDTLWFKAYLVNAQDNIPIATSNNLHVELIDAAATIRSSEIVKLENGFGHGDFGLDTLPAGTYRLRAYTNWMRNFGDNFFFEKHITLMPSASKNATAKSSTTQTAVIQTPVTTATTPAPPSPTVRFFPEGGSLVEGLSNIVAVKAEDAAGQGLPASGAVFSAAGDTVAHFSCDAEGMGLFTLLPVAGQTYKAVVTLDKKPSTLPLPPAIKAGVALQIRQTDSVLLAVISRNSTTLPSAYKLTVKHGGVSLISQDIQLTGNQLAAKIPTGNLPEGVAAITIYDDQNTPHCERLVYIHHPGQGDISIGTNKKSYKTGEPVTLTIGARPNSNLSVAVVDQNVALQQQGDIAAYLLLGSELHGQIHHAARYFDTTNVNRFKQLDMLLLTQGWRDFVWRRLIDSGIHISYLVETALPLDGRVIDDNNNKPIPDLNISMFAPEAKGGSLQSARADAQGYFHFPGLVWYGKSNLKLTSLNDKGDKRGSIQLDRKEVSTPNPEIVKDKTLPADSTGIKKAGQLLSANDKKKTAVIQLKEVKVRAKRSTLILRSGVALAPWEPEQAFDIKPEDKKYNTLEWFMLQRMKGAHQYLDSEGNSGIVFNGVQAKTRAMPNLTGGTNMSQLAAADIATRIFVNNFELNMEDPIQAEAYRREYYTQPITKFKKVVLKHMVGLMADYFLLYLTLADDATIDNPGSLQTIRNGYYNARVFYKPANDKEILKAGYRPTIHWEPDVHTDASGHASINFLNNGEAAEVIVQGITPAGVPVTGSLVIGH